MTTIAVIADVHGNRWALDAVLADAGEAGAERYVDLGDCVAGPLDPRGSAERLMELGALTVRGNADRETLAENPGPSAAHARRELSSAQLEWLAAHPATAWAADDVLACHGGPDDDTKYLLEEVVGGCVRRRAPTAVQTLLRGEAQHAAVVLCGHTHLPRVLPLPDGRTVVNPGSVGLPAYDHDVPEPHVMESGTPHARYALLRRDGAAGSLTIELRTVTYPWAQAAVAARRLGREDWAVPLETGIALPTATGRAERPSQTP